MVLFYPKVAVPLISITYDSLFVIVALFYLQFDFLATGLAASPSSL